MLYKNIAKRYALKNDFVQREQRDPNALIFVKPGVQLNVHFTTATVAVIIDEPGKSRKPVFVRDVDAENLKKLFKDAPAYMKYLETIARW